MSSENWLNMLTGLSQGNFDKLYIKNANGNVVDILTLLGQGGGSGGTVSSATLPLSITNGVLSLDLSGLMQTTHEANKIELVVQI